MHNNDELFYTIIDVCNHSILKTFQLWFRSALRPCCYRSCCYQCHNHNLLQCQHHLLHYYLPSWWPSAKASASKAADPGSNLAFTVGIYPLLSHTSDLSSSAFPSYISEVHHSSSSAFPSYISEVHHSPSSSAFPRYISGVHHSSSSSAFPSLSLRFTILGKIFAYVTSF